MKKMTVLSTTEKLAQVAMNKSRVKEYSTSTEKRVVYLNDGDEFQIELFNPYHYEIGISISFDEKSENDRRLILKPGERVWLDRYLDEAKKFKFSTYTVEDSAEAKSAISENGKITLKFYKEKEQPKYWTSSYAQSVQPKHHGWTNSIKTVPGPFNPWAGDNILYSSSIKSCDSNANINCVDNSLSSFGDICCDNIQTTLSCSCDTIETGRVEKGSQSNQNFEVIEKEFEYFPFKTESIKILPVSQKPVTSSDLTKKYCYNCGRKVKEKFKFCPFCGAEQ